LPTNGNNLNGDVSGDNLSQFLATNAVGESDNLSPSLATIVTVFGNTVAENSDSCHQALFLATNVVGNGNNVLPGMATLLTV